MTSDGRVDAAYRPDPTAARALRGVAGAIDGSLFVEGQENEVVAAVRGLVGEGPLVEQGQELHPRELAPPIAAVTIVLSSPFCSGGGRCEMHGTGAPPRAAFSRNTALTRSRNSSSTLSWQWLKALALPASHVR